MIKTSESTVEIFKALAQFQKEVNQPKKDANNPFFKSKYVPLENVVDVIHEAAAPLGLYESTYPVQEDGKVGVGVLITHESGEFIEYPPILLRPSKDDPQGYGAAMTYARRYALSAAFGIASETDDDGNSISGQPKPKPKPKPPETVTTEQDNELQLMIEELVEHLNDEDAKRKTTLWLVGKFGQSGGTLSSIERNNFKDAKDALQMMIDKNRTKEPEQEEVEQESLLEGSTTQPKDYSEND